MILDKIVSSTRRRIQKEKEEIPLEEMKKRAEKKIEITLLPPFAFEKVFCNSDLHFICEVKRASPSKGMISEVFPYKEIAMEYEKAGADCISVLTEPEFFLGKNEYLTEIKKTISLPIIRKDFIIDEYQIYESKAIGADGILLILALLTKEQLIKFFNIAEELSLSVLGEAHNKEEIAMGLEGGLRMIGINNRNLKTFKVDIQNSIGLRKYVPNDKIFIAESGITSRKEVKALEEIGVHGVLIGESLMRSKDKTAALAKLKGK